MTPPIALTPKIVLLCGSLLFLHPSIVRGELCIGEWGQCFGFPGSGADCGAGPDGKCGECCEGFVCGGTSEDNEWWKACRKDPAAGATASSNEDSGSLLQEPTNDAEAGNNGQCINEYQQCYGKLEGYLGACCSGLVCGGSASDSEWWKGCDRDVNAQCVGIDRQCYGKEGVDANCDGYCSECCEGMVCGGGPSDNDYFKQCRYAAANEINDIVTTYESLVTEWQTERELIVADSSLDGSTSIDSLVEAFQTLKDEASYHCEDQAHLEECIFMDEGFEDILDDFVNLSDELQAKNRKIIEDDISHLLTESIQGVHAQLKVQAAQTEILTLDADPEVVQEINSKVETLESSTTTVENQIAISQHEITKHVCFDLVGADAYLPMDDDDLRDQVLQFAKQTIQSSLAKDGTVADVHSVGLAEQVLVVPEMRRKIRQLRGDRELRRTDSSLMVQFVYQYKCLCGDDKLVSDVTRGRNLVTGDIISDADSLARSELTESFRTAWNDGLSDLALALAVRAAIGGVLSGVTKIEAIPCSLLY